MAEPVSLGASWAEGSEEDLVGAMGAPEPRVLSLPVAWTAVKSRLHVHVRLDVPVILTNGPGRYAWVRSAGEIVCKPRGWRKLVLTTQPVDCPGCLEEIARRWPSGKEST